MITVSGREVWPDGGHPSISDVGFGLARTPRFAGQTRLWYSVLAHTFSVTSVVFEIDSSHEVFALLHDAPEAIVGDVPTTWKSESAKVREVVLLQRISEGLGIPCPWSDDVWDGVKRADALCLSAEAMILGHSNPNHEHFLSLREDPLYEHAYQVTMHNLHNVPDPRDNYSLSDVVQHYAGSVSVAKGAWESSQLVANA